MYLFVCFVVKLISARLDRAFCTIFAFCVFIVGLMETVHGPPRTEKRAYSCIFGSYGTIYTFKNYFITVFSAKKQYPNKLLVSIWILMKN